MDQLQALVDNVNTGPAFVVNTDNYFANSSDDTRDQPGAISGRTREYIQYNNYQCDVSSIINQPSDSFWSAEYKKIFTANVILLYIDRVTGTRADKNRVKADAYFIRAEANWVLANYYR